MNFVLNVSKQYPIIQPVHLAYNLRLAKIVESKCRKMHFNVYVVE